MPISECQFRIGGDGRELVCHGNPAFPVACYNDDLHIHGVPWHWHEELEAVVIARGCCTVATDAGRFTLREGEGFFINSGVLHSCWDAEDSGCLFHSLVFHPRLVGGSLDSTIYQDYVLPLIRNRNLESLRLTPGIPWQARALEAIEAAWQAGAGGAFGYEIRLRGALSELVLRIRENQPGAAAPVGAKILRDAQRIKQMLQFLHGHWTEPLDTGAIAASAAVSESECLRCFRATVGTSPIRYLRQYRIGRAARLLEESALPVTAVAEQCGFPDVSYFTKTFREMQGCTPSAYRSRHRQGI